SESVAWPLIYANFKPMTRGSGSGARGSGLIQQKSHGAVVVRDDDVNVTVVVDVAERCAAADLRARERRPAGSARLLEAPGTGIVKQLVRHPIGQRLPAQRFDDVDAAVGDEQIEPPVVVIVDPVRAESGEGGGRPRETPFGAR